MSAVLWIVGGVAWLALGFTAARRMAKSWRNEFGDYEGMPVWVLVQATIGGPLGCVMAIVTLYPSPFAGLGAKVFGVKR